jgi:DNA transformation protein
MDRDDLIDLFSEFGPIAIRRMFSGYGLVADGVNFAMSLRAGLIIRVDDLTIGRYDAEGLKPFQYQTRNKTVTVKSYRHLPERLYDDPEELAVWAREAVGAAKRAKSAKMAKTAKTAKTARTGKRKAAGQPSRVPRKKKVKIGKAAAGKTTKTATAKSSRKTVRRPESGRSENTRGRPRK